MLELVVIFTYYCCKHLVIRAHYCKKKLAHASHIRNLSEISTANQSKDMRMVVGSL